jgi:hypothetical protein
VEVVDDGLMNALFESEAKRLARLVPFFSGGSP